MGYVYLLHFKEKLCHAGHYIGYAENNIEQRLERHRNKTGATIMKHVDDFTLVRIWKNVDRNFERRLKNCKNSKRFCPTCSGEKALRRMTNE